MLILDAAQPPVPTQSLIGTSTPTHNLDSEEQTYSAAHTWSSMLEAVSLPATAAVVQQVLLQISFVYAAGTVMPSRVVTGGYGFGGALATVFAPWCQLQARLLLLAGLV